MFRSRPALLRMLVLAILAFAYFVSYPEDVAAVLAPVERVLNLSFAVSPWLYGLLAVAVIAWAVVRVWGPREPAVPAGPG